MTHRRVSCQSDGSPGDWPNVLTVGHSTHSASDFLLLLSRYSVARLVDVRTLPRSRHNPQFNAESLKDLLSQVGIEYVHLPELGGLRRPIPESSNKGWRNPAFRGFADYMQTPVFETTITALVELIRNMCVVLMCAEAVPWRCHRSLIADALTLRGIKVDHILTPDGARRHRLTPWALADGLRVTYPPQ